MNAWTDFTEDIRQKPWRSRYWSRTSYLIWALSLIGAGFASISLLPVVSSVRLVVVLLYGLFLAVNVVYSMLVRRFGPLIQAAFIAVTCPLRVLLGLVLALNDVSATRTFASGHLMHLLGAYWYMLTIQYTRKLDGPLPNIMIIGITLSLPLIAFFLHGALRHGLELVRTGQLRLCCPCIVFATARRNEALLVVEINVLFYDCDDLPPPSPMTQLRVVAWNILNGAGFPTGLHISNTEVKCF